MEQIANDKEDRIYTRFDHAERLLGFQFLADMINRLFFLLIIFTEMITFFTTIVPLYAQYNADEKADIIEQLKNLED